MTDVFTYTVTDANGATSSTTLTITITGTNDAPVAVADTNARRCGHRGRRQSAATRRSPAMPSAIGNVLTNDTDVDTGDTKTVSEVNGLAGNVATAVTGTYGSLTLNADGSYSYTLDNADPQTQALAQGAPATDVFTYTVTDANGATSSTTLTITITGTNDAPVAVADANGGDAVTEAGVNPGNAPFAGDPSAIGNVLTNDTDVDTGDTKTVSEVNGLAANVATAVTGTYGSLTLNADGSWSYALDNADPQTQALAQGAPATDVFTYTVDRRQRRHLVDHADHQHHRHQRRPGCGRRHQRRRCGHRGRRQSRQHAVRRRSVGHRQRADQRHRRRHRRHQDGFRGQRLGRQRRHRRHRHLRQPDA